MEQWVRDKLGLSGIDAIRVTRYLVKKIATQGPLKVNQYMAPALKNVENKLRHDFARRWYKKFSAEVRKL